MKTAKFFSFCTRSQITAIATEIANSKVPGLKTTASTFIKGIAKLSGMSSEALLDSIEKKHKDAYQFKDAKAIFNYSDGSEKLVSIVFYMKVKGFWSDKISVCSGIIGDDGYLCDLPIGFTGSESGSVNSFSVEERNQNLQLALNVAFDVVERINKDKKKITPSTLRNYIDCEWNVAKIGK